MDILTFKHYYWCCSRQVLLIIVDLIAVKIIGPYPLCNHEKQKLYNEKTGIKSYH